MLEIIGGLFATGLALYAMASIVYIVFASVIFCGIKNSAIGVVIGFILMLGVITGWWFLVGTHIHLEFS